MPVQLDAVDPAQRVARPARRPTGDHGQKRGPCMARRGLDRGKTSVGGNNATYRITNLRGRSDRTGKRKKQTTKQARAPRLQPAKTSIRSHLLTVDLKPDSSVHEPSQRRAVTQYQEKGGGVRKMFMCGAKTRPPNSSRHMSHSRICCRDRGGV